jgi:hypothetical protein
MPTLDSRSDLLSGGLRYSAADMASLGLARAASLITSRDNDLRALSSLLLACIENVPRIADTGSRNSGGKLTDEGSRKPISDAGVLLILSREAHLTNTGMTWISVLFKLLIR